MISFQKSMDKRLQFLDWVMIAVVFALCTCCALVIDPDYCPDESRRKLVSDWIFSNAALPLGNEPEIIIPGYGFSYTVRPYLSAIMGAASMHVVCHLTTDPAILLAATRICSILSITAVCYYCLKAGRQLFVSKHAARLFAGIVCFLPQVIFLGSYQNNDALSLASVCMMLYYLVLGARQHWNVCACIGVALGMALCLLAYYNAYGWILMAIVFCLVSCLQDTEIPRKPLFIAKRAALIGGIVIVLAGWHFVRNAILLDGDFLGFRTEALTRQQLQDQGVELIRYTNLYQDGYPLSYMFQLYDGMFLSYTLKSYVGVFGYMNIFLPEIMYGLYLGMILMGILVYAAVSFTYKKNPLQRNIMWMMLGASIITIALHIAHSYFRDFQAQGRYILTTAVFLAWMIAYGFDHVEVRSHGAEAANRCSISAALFTNGMLLIWIALFVCALTNTMSQMF